MSRNHIRWKPPDPHFIKLNLMVLVNPIIMPRAAGFVIQDDQGRPILASSKHIGYSDVLVADAFALRPGLKSSNHQRLSSLPSRRQLVLYPLAYSRFGPRYTSSSY